MKKSVGNLVLSFFLLLSVNAFCLAVYGQDPEEADPNQAIVLFNQGQDAHEKGDFLTALKLYDEALKIFSEFPEAEYQKANALTSLNRLDEAEKSFRRALELKEDWSLALAGLGNLLVRKNKLSEAEKYLLQAVADDEQNYPAYSALVQLRIKQKASKETLKELLTKIQTLTSKANPSSSIWASQGALERVLGNLSSAKKSLQKALTLDPKNTFALSERIEASITESDFERALDDVKLLLKIHPDDENFKILLAKIQIEIGEQGEALKTLNELNQKNSEVIVLKNLLTINTSENLAELEKKLVNDPKNPLLLGRLCSLNRKLNPLKALEYCRLALENEPSNINHAVGFAGALVQAKQFENAVVVLQKILSFSPDNYSARANLAISFFQLKRYQEAAFEYQKLSEQKPQIAITYYFLAICYDNLQKYIDALAHYQKFLQLADAKQNQIEIEKVNLRLPVLQKQVKTGQGKKK